MANEIISSNRGEGVWVFELYNPSKRIGPFKGFLHLTKDFHIVFADSKLTNTLINIPSQNVAFVQKIEPQQ